MNNFNNILAELNFHDSLIETISFENAEGFLRRAEIVIDYYNWEGNTEDSGVWNWKKMKLMVEHCFHLRYIFPDLVEGGSEIMSMDILDKQGEIMREYEIKKPKIFYNILKDKAFQNTISVRFNTHCYGEDIFGESAGYLEVCGFNASIIWQEHNNTTGQIHIPVKNK